MHRQDEVVDPMVRIPSSRSKHYLTGMDWIVHGLDYMNKRVSGAGNMFQIVLDLDGAPAEHEVRECLCGVLAKCPIINATTRRHYNLAPYWEMPSHAHTTALALKASQLDAGADIYPLLEREVNTPFGSERDHISFHLVRSGESSHVAVKFDHRLFDAHGAEVFLGMLQREWEKGEAYAWESPLPEPAHLSQWRQKFLAGRQVNRALLQLRGNAPPRVLPSDPTASRLGCRFGIFSFDERQSEEIIDRAEDEAGYLMAMPYALALTVRVLHEVFASRGIDTGDYIIPVTMDTRPPGKLIQQAFFNHVSLFYIRIQAREVDDSSVLLNSIKQQIYEQVRAGLTRDIWDASFLMRIAPLPAVGYLIKRYFRGEVASFCFSFLRDTGHMPVHFMGKKVRRSYHMPRVPIPPGLGVFFHQSRGRLNVYVSYANGLLAEDEANTIVDTLRSRLEG